MVWALSAHLAIGKVNDQAGSAALDAGFENRSGARVRDAEIRRGAICMNIGSGFSLRKPFALAEEHLVIRTECRDRLVEWHRGRGGDA